MGMVGTNKAIQDFGTDGGGNGAVRVLRLKAMLGRVGIARSTAYEWMNPKSSNYDPTFPRSVKLSPGRKRSAVGWIESEVTGWIESRARGNTLRDHDAPIERSRHEIPDDVFQAPGGRTVQ